MPGKKPTGRWWPVVATMVIGAACLVGAVVLIRSAFAAEIYPCANCFDLNGNAYACVGCNRGCRDVMYSGDKRTYAPNLCNDLSPRRFYPVTQAILLRSENNPQPVPRRATSDTVNWGTPSDADLPCNATVQQEARGATWCAFPYQMTRYVCCVTCR